MKDTRSQKRLSGRTVKSKVSSKKAISKSKSGKKPSKKSSRKQSKKLKKRGFSGNNYNRIKAYLWKKHKKDFDSYHDKKFYSAVRHIYNACKLTGYKCTHADIEFHYADWKEQQKALMRLKPSLPLGAHPYYEIDSVFVIRGKKEGEEDIPQVILPDYVWFYSPNLTAKPNYYFTVNSYRYEKSFQEWVSWINLKRSENPELFPDSSSVPNYRFTDLKFEETTGRWEAKVIGCDADGNEEYYGFVPTGDLDDDGEVVIPEVPTVPKPPTTTPAPPTTPPDIEEAKQRAELRKLEIQRLKLEITAKERELREKPIQLLIGEQKRIMDDIKELSRLGAPKSVMDTLFAEYEATSKKLAELKAKYG